MTAVRPWFPFHVPHYRADTGRISTLEHGAYCLLLQEYWLGGPLPDDDRVLAGIAKLDLKVWQLKVGPVIRQFFQRHDDGLLHQKRADIERAKAFKLTETRASVGATGAAKAKANREAIAEASGAAKPQKTRARARATLNTSLSSLRSEREGSPSDSCSRAKRAESERAVDASFEEFYRGYPRKKAKADALKAWRSVLANGATAAEIIAGLARAEFSPDPKFVPYPATWLRAQQWLDKPDRPATAAPMHETARQRRRRELAELPLTLREEVKDDDVPLLSHH